MSAMATVTKMPPPRISELGHEVVTEIATRCQVSEDIVLQAMLLTSLANQSSLMSHIKKLEPSAKEG